MSYKPKAASSEGYKPLEIPPEFKADAPANSEAAKNSVPNFGTQEQPEQEAQPKEDKGTVSTQQCWEHLRSERDKLLCATDYVNMGLQPLSLEERAALYAYRKALRELPQLPGAPWTPDTIPWPVRPNGGAYK